MTEVTRIDLLRHGKVEGPAALYGKTDVFISEEGLQQMRSQAENLSFPQHVVSSPLRRCKEFAKELANQNELELHVEQGFRECDFGEWDGIEFDDNSPNWPLMTSFWQSPAEHTPPQGESLPDFHQRVIDAWQAITEQYRGDYSIIVCHGGVIRQILGHILPVDWQDGSWYGQLNIGYASLTRISIPTQGQPRVEFVGLPPNYGQFSLD